MSIKKSNQELIVAHEEGDIAATKSNRDEPWEIGFPWCDRLFYGSVSEVKALIKQEIKQNIAEEEAQAQIGN